VKHEIDEGINEYRLIDAFLLFYLLNG